MIEQLFPSRWIEKKTWIAFLLGLSYSIIGISSAIILFPKNPAMPSIALTSLLALPSLNKILYIETKQAAREKKFDLSDSFKNHKDVFQVYMFMFVGIFFTFAFFSIMLPKIAADQLFTEQIGAVGYLGSAAGDGGFASIFSNNFLIFAFALIASFFYGAGAIFILTWNASAWGVVFGAIARDAGIVSNANPFFYFILTIIAVAPHMLSEAAAYILAAISGGIISKAVILEKIFSQRFKKIILDALVIFALALVLLLVAAYIEAYLAKSVYMAIKSALNI